MKKLYILFGCATFSLSVSAVAQQLSNADFEGVWGDCIPWTFYQNEENRGEQSKFVSGVNPDGWVISNVSGMVSFYEGQPFGLGATVVGEKVAGYNSESAVKLNNSANPMMDSQKVPAYLTLGTAWSTANPNFGIGITIKNSDGGAFGGVSFTGRPTGIEFMYKRTRGEAKPDEKTTVVAYLWKGHWTQKDVPSIIYMAGEPYTTDMVDRDRCVLGMSLEGCQGGEVSKTDDAELIAVINAEITTNADEWTKFSADFDYKSDATPEMINIIIAAGDYFGGADVIGENNSLIVDDVKLIYAAEPEADKYPGNLTIEMNGGTLTPEPMAAEVQIAYTADDKCTLILPNFTLDLGSGPANLGDIVVPDVTVVTENNVAKYTGSITGLKLYGGLIVADAEVNGTIDSEGVAKFHIDVIWNNIPIKVEFNGKGKPGKGTAGIESVEVDNNAQAEYYNMNGVRVNAENLTPGLYIERKGSSVRKIIVR